MAKPKTAERSSGTDVGSKSMTASPDETTISPRRHGYLKNKPSCTSRTTGGKSALEAIGSGEKSFPSGA